jgi:hypothetical protein
MGRVVFYHAICDCAQKSADKIIKTDKSLGKKDLAKSKSRDYNHSAKQK